MVCSKDPQNDIGSDKPDLKRFIAHRVREIRTLVPHLFSRPKLRIVVFESNSLNNASGLLWGRGALAQMKSIGWDVILAPPQLELIQRQRLCKLLKPDAIVFIKARVWKNHPHHYPNIPSIFILDDADYLVPAEGEHIIQCLQSASAVVAANEHVATWCKKYNNEVSVVWVPHPPRQSAPAIQNADRKNIIMWAPAGPAEYPVEAEFVSNLIRQLQSTRDDFEFWMTGCRNKEWSDKFAEPLIAAGVKLKQFGYFKDYKEYLDTIAQTPIGLHPVKLDNDYAHGKSFGKTLSYMVSSTTVITDEVPDHSDFFNHKANAMVANTTDEYIESISYLLDHPEDRQAMADQAYLDFLDQLATPVAAKKMDEAIRKAINRAREVHS